MFASLLIVVAAFVGVTALAAGVAIGLTAHSSPAARRRIWRAWLVAAAAFLALNAVTGAVTLQCPRCRNGSENSRAISWAIGFVWSGILLMEVAVSLAAGGLVGLRLRAPEADATRPRPMPGGKGGR